MTIFEMIILFWVLPSLITSLLIPHILDTGPYIVALDRDDLWSWGMYSLVYPAGVWWIIIVVLCNSLKKGPRL